MILVVLSTHAELASATARGRSYWETGELNSTLVQSYWTQKETLVRHRYIPFIFNPSVIVKSYTTVRPCLLKMPAVLPITLLRIFRCAVDVHLYLNEYNFARFRCDENRCPQDHFRCVMVCYCTRTFQKTMPDTISPDYITIKEWKWCHFIFRKRVGSSHFVGKYTHKSRNKCSRCWHACRDAFDITTIFKVVVPLLFSHCMPSYKISLHVNIYFLNYFPPGLKSNRGILQLRICLWGWDVYVCVCMFQFG